MYHDIECPYCEAKQDINHNDGYGYDEDELHEQICDKCDKTFGYYTSISFYYKAKKTDCLNGAEHKWKKVQSHPNPYPDHVRCTDCEKEVRGKYDPEIMEKYFKDIEDKQKAEKEKV